MASNAKPLRPRPSLGVLATFAFSYFAVGVTVSVALVERSTPTAVILGAAALIYSATSELAYIAVRDGDGSQVAAIVSGWLVASRFGLLATALGAKMGGQRLERFCAAITTVDPSVALATQHDESQAVRSTYWLATVALLAGWLSGNLVGVVLGNVVDNIETYGFDAVLPAALLAILGPALRRRDGLTAALLGAVICLLLIPIAPGGVPILVSVVGAIVAARWVRPTGGAAP